MEHYKRARRFGSLVLTALVAILTLSVMGHATQVITTPNAAFFSYSLASGANSAPITPVANQSVLVMGTQTTINVDGREPGESHVTLLRIAGRFLEWTGLESCCPGAITSNFSNTPGAHIVYLDMFHSVDIQVNTADTFRIHNGSSVKAMGNVTLIW
jgi:hypothetical protein